MNTDTSEKAMLPLKAEALDGDGLADWFAGKRPRRLLAIPFGGPLDSPHNGRSGQPGRGMDLDREFFSPRTDIKADWLETRDVDWHHGRDPLMGRAKLGKADRLGTADGTLGEPDEYGWWVDQWFAHGEKRVELVKRLQARGAELYGSSESIAGMTRKAATGEILAWPYWRQTLTTSPQNRLSVLRPLKAALMDALTDYDPSQTFWDDVVRELHDVGADLRLTSLVSDGAAKSGRMLSALNEQDIDEAVEALVGSAERLRGVLARHRGEPTT